MRSATASRGFTLVELLVALFAMALLAVMSWRGLDGMARAQAQTEERADQVLTLQIGLAQWGADLDALTQLPQTTALEWNGRVLRMTRRSSTSASEGIMVVAWTRRLVGANPVWLRWQSPPVTTRGQIEEAWQRADLWSQNPSDEERLREVPIGQLDDWQIFFYRENAWTNPQSSAQGTAVVTAAPATSSPVAAIPEGVRLVLTLPAGHAISGTLTRDWVRPLVAGQKS